MMAKHRTCRTSFRANASKDVVEEAAKQAVDSYLEGKTIKKVIVVPGKLVNIVAI